MIKKYSHSEVESYLQCERRHFYSYGHEIQGIYTSEALERGIMIHAALATYYEELKGGATKAVAEAKGYQTLAQLGNDSQAYDGVKLLAQCADLLIAYFNHYRDEDIEVLAVETEYLVPITDDYSLQVRIDLICRVAGRVIVRDHKVIYDFYNAKKTDLQSQLPKYLAGLWSMQESPKIDLLEYNEIRHRTTEENKHDPSLRFRHTEVPITRQRVLTTLTEQLQVAKRIASLRAKGLDEWGKTVVRNSSACGNCPFTNICTAELNGEDIEMIKKYDYRPKTKRAAMNS
jgi:hypothetical protein